MKAFESDISKMCLDLIVLKEDVQTMIQGMQQMCGKMDTLIALKEVELGRQQPLQELQQLR